MVKSERDKIEDLDAQSIRNYLVYIRTRMYRQTLLQTITSALFCGLILLTILFFFNRVILLPMQVSTVSWLTMFVAVIIGICLSVRHRTDLLSVARTVDQKMELDERLSTAFELMQTNPQGEFAQLQIQDTAEAVLTLDVAEISPYGIPKFLKLFPVPLLLIGLSFTVPTFYEVPKPLTEAQQQALDRTTQRLEGKQVENSTLQARISETVNKLKTATDLDTAQRHLSSLKKEVRKQQSTQNAITEATEASQSFQGMAADQFAAELKALTEQHEIPPELQAELMNIFERLAERLPKGPLSDSLNQIQGKAVTPETLRDIIAALEEMEKSVDLAQLEAQLAASQKDLALATIAPETSGDGVANSDGAPGQDAGTSEVQGTRENTSNSEAQTTDMGEMGNETDTENSTTPLTGEEASISQIDGEQLTLTAEISGTAESFSGVFTGETRDNAPVYLPFSDVVLNAERAYAEAIENNRIPVRYQAQIKAYLEAISRDNEK